MAVNKVIFNSAEGEQTLIDLTGDTATAEAVFEGATFHGSDGEVKTGTFTIAEELSDQDSLIAQIQDALQGKAAGGGAGDPDLPSGYKRVDYIYFSGKQTVDTGIVCNQDTEIKVVFTREKSSQHYMYGVASSDNTASVTAYLGGSWRFGNKSATKTPGTSADMIYSGVVNGSKITTTGSATTISDVNAFETIGSLLLGACRSSSGAVSASQFVGKIFNFAMWSGTEQVLKLVPVTDGNGVYRFWDIIGRKFHDSITDAALEGGNL